jgi:hypothetical protein
MLDTDGYLKMTASNYQQANSHLMNAERELNKVLKRITACAELMGNPPNEERPRWSQVDDIVNTGQPLPLEAM